MKAKILCLILAVLTLCAAVLSCSSERKSVWLKYKDAEITEASYRFWLATTKYYAVSSGGVKDTLEGWNENYTDEKGNTGTVAEYIEERARDYAIRTAVKLQLFSEFGLTLSSEETAQNDDYLNKLIYERYGDSKSAFNEELKKVYGITLDDLEQTLTVESKAAAVDEYLFGENGPMAPTKEEKEKYYADNYVRLQIVAINLEKEYVKNDDGTFATDESGNYVIKTYTDEERAAKRAVADAVMQWANEGEEFTDLVMEFSEQVNKTHADGIYFRKSDVAFADANGISRQTVSAMFAQEIGQVVRYETPDRAIYIVKRLPLVEGAYALTGESDQFATFEEDLLSAKTDAYYRPLMAEVQIDDRLYELRVVDISKGIL